MKHEASKGEVVKPGKRLSQALIVAGQSSETRGPGKASLDNPAARQQDKSVFGLGVLDHFQFEAVRLRLLCGILTSVALIRIGDFYRVAADFPHGLSQLFYLRPVLFVGRGHVQSKQIAQGIHRRMYLGAFALLDPVVTAARARPPAWAKPVLAAAYRLHLG